MAIMLPQQPREIEKNSLEDIMFEALRKLPDEYYVFHSFRMISIIGGVMYESETDFVVFNPNKGILCIEAKAGKVKSNGADWFYGSGKVMGHGGPFNQADQNKWKLSKYFEYKGMSFILSHCKLLHAVWFPSIDINNLNQIQFPAEGDRLITLTSEALYEPNTYIEKLFSIELPNSIKTILSDYETKKIIDNVLCPTFELLPSLSSKLDIKRHAFNKMLREQANILNFLEEQPNAVINGVAGSGKTMIAVEKARRHAEKAEKVLFLCFNKFLCDFLKTNYFHEYISYYTIDGFACSYCNTSIANFELLQEKLENEYYEQIFKYKHIIIDEGQDFGQYRIEESNIIEMLEMIVLSNESQNGTFYLFYDKNQLIQGFKVPKYISDADCKLTLYKNCRNTENIAVTSMRPLGKDKKPKLFDGCIKGDSPQIYISSNPIKQIEYLDIAIRKCLDGKITDIVILTCVTEEKSILYSSCTNGEYSKLGRKIKFTTCRKFKGLEADAVILIDVEKSIFDSVNALVFYVGSSRARFSLDIICNLTEEENIEVLNSMGLDSIKRPKKALAAALNTMLVQ